ncbi:MAG: phosphotransferase family protein [Candidatus Thorarchaeota archaeon]|jgi:aminoglycoside phosphotransferase (APT) family kinase protein
MQFEKLEEYLLQRFPGWTDIAVRNVKDITSGWETEILSFDIEYTESGIAEKKNWISRAYPGGPGMERAKSEFRTYQILHSLNYRVPHVLLLETDSSWMGKPFIIMDRIIGQTVQEMIESGDEEARLQIIKEMGILQVELHKTDWSQAAGIPEEEYKVKPKDKFLQRIEGFRNWISNGGVEYLLPLVDWLQDNHHKISFDKHSITHGDFHPMNVLVDAEGNYFVIDWTAARLGDYRSDLAWSMILAFIYNDNEYWQLILKEYEIAAGEKVENIDYFLIEAAIRRFADILISLSEGAESQGMLKETEKEMRSSLHLLTKLHGLVEKITGIRVKSIDDTIKQLS